MAAEDALPVFAFFITYIIFGIYPATAVVMVVTAVQVGLHWWRTQSVDAMKLASLALVLIFGGATLLLHDERFLKMKPTVLYWSIAIAFAASHFIGPKLLVERVFSSTTLNVKDQRTWFIANVSWIVFLLLLGGLNLILAYSLSTTAWVYFKLFGTTSLLFMFASIQFAWLSAQAENQLDAYADLRRQLIAKQHQDSTKGSNIGDSVNISEKIADSSSIV